MIEYYIIELLWMNFDLWNQTQTPFLLLVFKFLIFYFDASAYVRGQRSGECKTLNTFNETQSVNPLVMSHCGHQYVDTCLNESWTRLWACFNQLLMFLPQVGVNFNPCVIEQILNHNYSSTRTNVQQLVPVSVSSSRQDVPHIC